ncbi:MAG TPA: hypothetical protein ACFCUY_13865 [Xenococcaceae cyanobacterium]
MIFGVIYPNGYFYGSLYYVFSCEEDAKAAIAISNRNSEFDWDKVELDKIPVYGSYKDFINESAGVEKFEELYKVELADGEFVGLFSKKDDAEIVAAMQPYDENIGAGASFELVKVYPDIRSWMKEYSD